MCVYELQAESIQDAGLLANFLQQLFASSSLFAFGFVHGGEKLCGVLAAASNSLFRVVE